jgi:hypothetical protein
MAGRPKMKERRERSLRLREKPEFWDALFEEIAGGMALMEFARIHDLPYTTVREWILKDDALAQRFAHARSLRADRNAAAIERLAQEVEDGGLDPHRAKVSIDARKWIAERMDPQAFGQKQALDIKVQDVSKLHLEALRERMKPKVINPDEGDLGD